MNNKGFIATSIMYSFFIVFTLMTLSILATYTHYTKLNVQLNKYIKEEIKNKVINDSDYDNVLLNNIIVNGDFENGTTNPWDINYSDKLEYVTNRYFSSNHSMVFQNYESSNKAILEQLVTNPITNEENYFYLRVKMYKENTNGYDCLRLGFYGSSDSGNVMTSFDGCDYHNNTNVLSSGSWNVVSAIFAVDSNKTNKIINSSNLGIELLIAQNNSHINSNAKYYIDDVMLINITDIFDKYYDFYDSENQNNIIKDYLDTKLDYFNDSTELKKCIYEGDSFKCPE